MNAMELLATQVAAALQQAGKRLITAESCTGGLAAATLTSIPGSSEWFEGAFVTYRLSAKKRFVGVPAATLDLYGAVSEPTVRAMAEGALNNSDADISVAITGIAGPEGGDVVSPVGTVWFGWAIREEPDAGLVTCIQTTELHLAGDRRSVRESAVQVALQGVLDALRRQD
jgi:nicotinamide-nucleotide amidase